MTRHFDTDADKERVEKLWFFEDEAVKAGYKLIAGVDEAGRGSLVGPMVVAAVILPQDKYFEKLDDSKKLSQNVREKLYDEIVTAAISVSSVLVSVEEIDTLNVYQSTINGMYRAIRALHVKPDFVLTDAMKLDFKGEIKTRSIIHGDALSASIAAASIVAKVTRDRLTDVWSEQYPEYGFDRNRGYGTKEHFEAIKKFGYTPLHRRSFDPVRSILAGKEIREYGNR